MKSCGPNHMSFRVQYLKLLNLFEFICQTYFCIPITFNNLKAFLARGQNVVTQSIFNLFSKLLNNLGFHVDNAAVER